MLHLPHISGSSRFLLELHPKEDPGKWDAMSMYKYHIRECHHLHHKHHRLSCELVAKVDHLYFFLVNTHTIDLNKVSMNHITGLEITARHQTMSGHILKCLAEINFTSAIEQTYDWTNNFKHKLMFCKIFPIIKFVKFSTKKSFYSLRSFSTFLYDHVFYSVYSHYLYLMILLLHDWFCLNILFLLIYINNEKSTLCKAHTPKQ